MLPAEGNYKESKFSFHARPMGIDLDYDWNRLKQTLIDSGAIINFQLNVFAMKARNIIKLWAKRITNDDLSVLTDDCGTHINSRLMYLGRSFVISDFEGDC